MAAKLTIKTAFIDYGHTTVREVSEDGPVTLLFDNVICETTCGRTFILPNTRTGRDDDGLTFTAARYHNSDRMLAIVLARGEIDPEAWIEHFPADVPSLEDKLGPFGIEWQLEQEERHGAGA